MYFRRFASYFKVAALIIKKEDNKVKGIVNVINNANLLLQRKIGFCLPLMFGQPKDGLYYPEGMDKLKNIENIYQEKTINYSKKAQKINVFIPGLSKDLIFGGYISLFNFLHRLIEYDYELRIIICDPTCVSTTEDFLKEFEDHDLIGSVLKKSEINSWANIDNLSFGYDDLNIGYSWITMYYASLVARHTYHLPLFFIQEYESIFYSYDSIRALCDQTYSIPHKAIFNSKFLKDFFKQKGLGVFEDEAKSQNYITFEHTFADLDKPDRKTLISRKKKKLLFYARPEAHAARNLFELATYALIRAIDKGIFDDDWEFYGVGSLKPLPKVKLGNGCYLKMLPRVSFDEYKKMLSEFDIGLSPMYAPHPSVPPFEMASAGLISITTTFENRSKTDMESISGNIIACKPTVNELLKALSLAKDKSYDIDSRIKYSQFDWPRSWKDSFSDEFLSEFRRLIDAK